MFILNQRKNVHVLAVTGRNLLSLFIAVTAIANLITVRTELPWNNVAFTEPLIDLGGSTLERDGLIVSGIILLVLARALMRGKRQAWWLSVALLAFSLLGAVVSKSDRSAILLLLCLLIFLVALAPVFPTHSDMRALLRGYVALGLSACGLSGYWSVNMFWHPGSIASVVVLRNDVLFLLHVLVFLVLGYGVIEVLRPVRMIPAAPGEHRDERFRAWNVVRRYGRLATVHFALGMDKHYFWSGTKRAMIAYRVAHGVALALGDPIGPEEEHEAVLREFLTFCRQQDWSVALYQASEHLRSLCQNNGLYAFKIGEEAIINVSAFSVEGKHGAPVRHAMARAGRAGLSVQCWQGEELPPAVFSDMKRISAEWLHERGVSNQMGFSIGRFPSDWSPDTLTVVASGERGEVQAFLTWTPLYAGNGWSLDAMRRSNETAPGAIELLIASSIEWAKARCYSRMSLGLVPLVGVGEQPGDVTGDTVSQQYLAPFASFWERSASYLHRRGVVLGNYRSLYAFKAKFHPHWESRYLLVSEKQAAPRILLALVQVHSGGWSSMLKESCCRIVFHIKLVVSSM